MLKIARNYAGVEVRHSTCKGRERGGLRFPPRNKILKYLYLDNDRLIIFMDDEQFGYYKQFRYNE